MLQGTTTVEIADIVVVRTEVTLPPGHSVQGAVMVIALVTCVVVTVVV